MDNDDYFERALGRTNIYQSALEENDPKMNEIISWARGDTEALGTRSGYSTSKANQAGREVEDLLVEAKSEGKEERIDDARMLIKRVHEGTYGDRNG